MSSFTVLLFCVQVLLIQNVFGQYIGYGGIGGPATIGSTVSTPLGLPSPGYNTYGYKGNCDAGYGGIGFGNLAAMGELPVSGTTVVAGQVPIIGAVEFGGTAAAAGIISMSGSCGCGCNNPYAY